jgi:protein SCO1/2
MAFSRWIGLGAAILVAVVILHKSQTPTVTVKLPVHAQVKNFDFTDHDGKPFTARSFAGKVWVIDFFFTSCQGPCPLLTQNMLTLHKALMDEDDFCQLSVTVDPKRDSIERLRSYAQEHEIDTGRWRFLRSDLKSTIAVLKDVFELPAGEDPNMHTTRFVLIDQQGRIRGYYQGADRASLVALKRDVRALLGRGVPLSA